MVAKIGVLALQGSFAKHKEVLDSLGYEAVEVRYSDQFDEIDALIIPGGESTTMSKVIAASGLYDKLVEFAANHPIMGTCAGLIMMSEDPGDDRVRSFGLLDITIARNGWGSQIHSFTTDIEIHNNGDSNRVEGVFIRAPRIESTGPEVEVLAEIDGEPVMVRHRKHIGLTFHPELTSDKTIHQLFLRGLDP